MANEEKRGLHFYVCLLTGGCVVLCPPPFAISSLGEGPMSWELVLCLRPLKLGSQGHLLRISTFVF